MTSTLETKAAALEGLDFIETEEDVKAVEAATLKIQSTFRGKKIRSKITAPKPTSQTSSATSISGQQQRSEADQKQKTGSENKTAEAKRSGSKDDGNNELSRKVAEMQVHDNNNNNNQMDGQHQKPEANTPAGLPEEEAQRAATKIQAGFKGYKTRKELEGKLAPTSSSSGQQEAAAE